MEDVTMTQVRLRNNWSPSFPSYLDRIFEGDMMDWNTWNFTGSNSTLPAVNLKETEYEFTVELAAPGLKKGDFRLNYDNGRLTISAEKKHERKEKNGGKIARREFSYQTFQRSFSIDDEIVNADKISAKYIDGILHVSLPKHEEVKSEPFKEIKIS
jgi:HSP20 family protein